MKKIIVFVALAGIISNVRAQRDFNELKDKVDTVYLKKHPKSALAAVQAYIFLAQRSKMYGSLSYTSRIGSDMWGWCEGWERNFFSMIKNANGHRQTGYIRLWQVHHATIKEENGYQFLYVYASPGQKFELRDWEPDEQDYTTGETSWVKMYIDWSAEDGLIDKMKLAFDLWGKFNNHTFNDTEKFDD